MNSGKRTKMLAFKYIIKIFFLKNYKNFKLDIVRFGNKNKSKTFSVVHH